MKRPDNSNYLDSLNTSRSTSVPIPDEDKKPRSPRRRALPVVASAVIAVLLLAGGYVWYNYDSFVSGVGRISGLGLPAANASDINQNILLVGDDHRPAGATAAQIAELGTGDDGGGLNTDTMMVLHVPANGAKATLISFPRDSWVAIPGYGMSKLNSAFQDGTENGGGNAGGARLLISVIHKMTGLTISHFVRVSMLGFYGIAKALGPVTVCLNEAVDDPYSTVDLPKGVSTLDAKQALAFVRQRHGLANGDLDREVRQQYFLAVEARKVLSAGTLLNPVRLQQVLSAVSSSLQTDRGFDFIALAEQLHGLNANNLTAATIPVSATPTISTGGGRVSVVQVDTRAMPAFIASITGVTSPYASASAAPVSGLPVQVENASGAGGAATRAAAALTAIGFAAATPTTAPLAAFTTVEYPSGKEAEAKTVAEYLPGADVSVSSTVTEVTVLLGTDGRQVSRAASGSATSGSGGTSSATKATAAPVAPVAPARSFAKTTCIN